MKLYLTSLTLNLVSLFLTGSLGLAQTVPGQDVLPETSSSASTAVLNDQLRQQQSAINTIGGYFTSDGYLSSTYGGTGQSLGSHNQGDIYYDDGSSQFLKRLTPGTASYFLQTRGSGADPAWAKAIGVQFFAADGTFTAPTGITKVYVTLLGAGGGGGGSDSAGNGAGGGGGGQFLPKMPYTVVPGNNYAVVVGVGGGGGAAGVAGSDGEASTFDSSLTAAGGSGGAAGSGSAAGGAGGGGSLSAADNVGGKAGITGGTGGTGDGSGSGGGGGTGVGTGPNGFLLADGSNNGVAGTDGWGAGGSGAMHAGANRIGGDGGDGLVIVEY